MLYVVVFFLLHVQCDDITSVREFLTQVRLPSPTLVGIIGCGCSVATEPVADMVSIYGLPLVSRLTNIEDKLAVVVLL